MKKKFMAAMVSALCLTACFTNVSIRTNASVMPSGDWFILGDVNNDHFVDLRDLTELSLVLIGDKIFTEDQIKAADVNENGKVDLTDFARLKQYVSMAVTSLKPGTADELNIGYYEENDFYYCSVMGSNRIALRCKSFCNRDEILKVDAAIGAGYSNSSDSKLNCHYIYSIYASDIFCRQIDDENLIINQEQSKFIKEYSKEEWPLFNLNGQYHDYDSYYHETAEIDFKNYEAGSSGIIRFNFYAMYDEKPDSITTDGDAQYLYYYIGESEISLGRSAKEAKKKYFARFKDEAVPDEFTLTVTDDYWCLAEPVEASYEPGETISIVLNPLTEKYYKINFNNTEEIISAGTKYSFVMPDEDAEITIELVDSL